ncbi:guanylate kinase [Gehongia tenuis]|uniref:Guanylate kinase n=1 Tax=Gehongia tenuis TaxID=2763655 RepID=A0A926D5I9_9FIRM|nr:guanylate kinase [Gehongia tenuis]MBC8530760.1 guanylate kinase [Gehongia tenuis]
MSVKGLLIVVSGPSGAGKGTVMKGILERDPNIRLSISATTRRPRETEQDGVHYFFKTREEFLALVDKKGFLEYAQVYDQYYGTPRAFVEEQLDAGRDVLLEIDVQGGMNVKKAFPEAVTVFLAPPSMTELERRIRFADTGTRDNIETRLEWARQEIAQIPRYGYCIVNDDINGSVEALAAIIRAEKLACWRRPELTQNILEGAMDQ